jgi:hypothetical protein
MFKHHIQLDLQNQNQTQRYEAEPSKNKPPQNQTTIKIGTNRFKAKQKHAQKIVFLKPFLRSSDL